MRAYRVEFTSAAAKQVRKLEPSIRRRILAAVSTLERDPRPAGAKKLVGEESVWRLRVGAYRVIYDFEDDRLLITVVRTAHRREAYQ